MAVGGQFNKKEYSDLDKLSEQFGGREFLIFDLDGNLIGSRISQTAFAEEIGVCVQTVNNVLLGIKNSTKDYILFFKEEFTEQKLKDKIQQIKDNHKPFAVFDKEWNLVGIWDNKVVCAKEIDITRRTMQRQLNTRKGLKSPRKYRFYYLEEVPLEYKYKIQEVI